MKSPFKKIGRSLRKLEKSAERELKKAGKTVETGAKAAAKSVETGVKATGHMVGEAAHKVGDVAQDVGEGISEAASAVGRGAKSGIDTVMHAGEAAVDELRADLAALTQTRHDAELIAQAEAIAAEHASGIQGLHRRWEAVRDGLGADIAILRKSAKQRDDSPQTQAALHRVLKALEPALESFCDRSFVGVGLEIGGSAGGTLAVADGSVGFLCGLPNFKNVHLYVSVMVSLGSGLEAGASGDVSVAFVIGPPEDSGGANISVVGHFVTGIGGTVTVALDPAKMCLSGITVGLSGGAQLGAAVGGGYTHVF